MNRLVQILCERTSKYSGFQRWLFAAGGWVLLVLVLLVLIRGQERRAPSRNRGEWVRLTSCRLIDSAANDGDSFHVRYAGEEYIFRLYFVDAPETDERFPTRLNDQAAVYGISRARILELGEQAKVFTREVLQKPFTVHTRWQDAFGSSLQPRFFAFVELPDGRDLAEELVSAGLARIHGVQAHHPDGRTTAAQRARLYQRKKQALENQAGGWNGKK